MLVLSQAYTFITGNFDLSVESTLGLTAMFAALMLVTTEAGGLGWQLHPLLVILLMLVLGGLIGLFNGVLITKVGVNNLLVTIAMLFVLRGATYGISPGTSISFFPKEFTWLGGGTLTRIVTDNGNFRAFGGRHICHPGLSWSGTFTHATRNSAAICTPSAPMLTRRARPASMSIAWSSSCISSPASARRFAGLLQAGTLERRHADPGRQLDLRGAWRGHHRRHEHLWRARQYHRRISAACCSGRFWTPG